MFLTENANNAENSAAELKNAAGAFLPFKPLKPSADSLPPFPIDCLPFRLRSYVEAVAIHTQTPMDMAAGAALGVLAACLQGKVRLRLHESSDIMALSQQRGCHHGEITASA